MNKPKEFILLHFEHDEFQGICAECTEAVHSVAWVTNTIRFFRQNPVASGHREFWWVVFKYEMIFPCVFFHLKTVRVQ